MGHPVVLTPLYGKDLQKIMDKIDSLADDTKMIPYVVILLIRDNDMVSDPVRHAGSPPVVSLLAPYVQVLFKATSVWSKLKICSLTWTKLQQ
jgi:hypothetical protein